jgi:hypothetical protein
VSGDRRPKSAHGVNRAVDDRGAMILRLEPPQSPIVTTRSFSVVETGAAGRRHRRGARSPARCGPSFAAAQVVYAGAATLYQTSGSIRYYPTDQHVVAALGLFASVALLLWNLLNILHSCRG